MAMTTEPAAPVRRTGRDLALAFSNLKSERPGVRARDAAQALGVSEGELVASRVGDDIVRLDGDYKELLAALPPVGEVMALTRNEHVVHEKHGAYGNVSFSPGGGLVLNHDIDLRLFMGHWKHGFAVTEEVPSGRRSSLQFFDADGGAIHKVYATDHSDMSAYRGIVERFRAREQSPELDVSAPPAPKADRADAEIDRDGLLKGWRELKDTHEFFGLLRKFGVGRRQAMRFGAPEFARPVAKSAPRAMLEAAAAQDLPIMCFVGNPGCIQIHTGPVKNLKATGPWFNVLDKGFNLHMREDAIDAAYVVRKPTEDGDVTSLEVFDKSGFCFVQFFGERKPGKKELEDWRKIVAALPAA